MAFPESKSVAWKVVEELLGITFSAAATGTPSASTALFGDGSWKATPTASSGPWTPIDSSGAGLTFASAVGTYVNHGDVYFATANITYPATASGATALIGGLPATVASGAYPVCGAVSNQGTALSVVGVVGFAIAAPYFATTAAALTNANLSGKTISFTLVYEH